MFCAVDDARGSMSCPTPGFEVGSIAVSGTHHVRKVGNLRTAVIAATAVGALVLSACGGGSGSTSTTAAATSPAGTTSAAAGATTSAAAGTTGTDQTAATTVSDQDIAAAKAALIDPSALTVCTHLAYKPFQFTEGDQVVGFDVDLLDLAAERLGVEQRIIDTPFEGIKSGEATGTGKCDAAAAAMTITPEREQVMLFSIPYFDATQVLVVPSASTATSLADLNGQRVGAQSGTTGLDYVKEQAPSAGFEIVEYQDFPSEADSLLLGQLEGAVNDVAVWNDYLKANEGQIKIATQFDTGEQYGVGMKPDATALKNVIDASISEAKADGTYDQIYEKWIGGTPPS